MKQATKETINNVIEQSGQFVAPEIDDSVDTDSPVSLVTAAIEAGKSGQTSPVASEYSDEQLDLFRSLFNFPTIPDFGRDKAKAIPKLRDWAKDQTTDGIALINCKSIVNWAFGLVADPEEMSENSSEDGKLKVSFKATHGMERTVNAALEALASESTKSIEKTWWADTSKGFKVVVNGVGKLPDGAPTSTVTSGQFTGKTVDTNGRLRRAILHINRCASYLHNGKDAKALDAYLLLTGNAPTAEGKPDFFFEPVDVKIAVQVRLHGLISRDARDLATQYEKDLKESKNAAVKTMQNEAEAERDEERAEQLKKSLERQRNAPTPGKVPDQPIPKGKEFITWEIHCDKFGNETERKEVYRGIDGKEANKHKAALASKGNGITGSVETVYIY